MLECGYDAGDCGTDKYTNMHGLLLSPSQTHYTLPAGRSPQFYLLQNSEDEIVQHSTFIMMF